ncbi:hypothetical protein BD626DRAFT_632260 [Schizophyllum amplum]|uniref:Protein kinase domain-containing protein n=1 Tax=Schizophyllum amplum TaxID=97359 RepID=A0A550C7Y7_9AGAR|nr:hypothetical protein BD626DRAFT_632260 [Auriculariopsis ampla]
MRGRGTVCWRCRACDAGPEDEDVVIKSLWADQSRAHTEAEFLRVAQGIEGISTLIAEELVMEGDPLMPRSTANIRQALRDHSRDTELVGIEERHQYRLVLKPYALHVENFSSRKELLNVFKDAISAHEQLVYDRRILHSDISDNNVMMRTGPPGSLRGGLLIDLDYAAFIGEQRDSTSTAHRTGTLPFMAWEILKNGDKIPHEPRHDLESFLYVLILVCICHSGPNRQYRRDFDLPKSRFGRWMDLDAYLSDIGSAKEAVMCLPKNGLPDEFPAFIDELFDPYFEDLKPCVHELREVILGPASSNPRAMHCEVLGILQRYIDQLSHPDGDPRGVKRKAVPAADAKKVSGWRSRQGRADGRRELEGKETSLEDTERIIAVSARALFTENDCYQDDDEEDDDEQDDDNAKEAAPLPVGGHGLRGARGSDLADAAMVGRLRSSQTAGVLRSYNEDDLERRREEQLPDNYRLSSSQTKRRKLKQ